MNHNEEEMHLRRRQWPMGYDAEGSEDFREPEWTINVWSNGLDYEVIRL